MIEVLQLLTKRRNGCLFAQQKQTDDRKRDADYSLPRRCFAEKQDACERHDRRAASKDCRNDGEWATFLEKQKKRDRAGADANAGKQGIIKTSYTGFLIPSSRNPKDRQVDEDRQCRAGFNNKTAETFTNAIGSKPGKDLVCTVKYGSNDRVPKPGCHKTGV